MCICVYVRSGIPEFPDQAVEDRPGYEEDPDAAGILNYTDRDFTVYREFLQKQSGLASEKAAAQAVAAVINRPSSAEPNHSNTRPSSASVGWDDRPISAASKRSTASAGVDDRPSAAAGKLSAADASKEDLSAAQATSGSSGGPQTSGSENHQKSAGPHASESEISQQTVAPQASLSETQKSVGSHPSVSEKSQKSSPGGSQKSSKPPMAGKRK